MSTVFNLFTVLIGIDSYYSKVMFSKQRLNLKLKKYALVILSLLFVIFLIHPGRFSEMSYDIVPENKIKAAHSKYSTKISEPRDNYLCEAGGLCYPESGEALPMIAILVPYRERQEQLHLFLSHMHYFLREQGLRYMILVVEQMSQSKFNRAKLLNIGFKETERIHPGCKCFIFHDVDLLPVSEENIYVCHDRPRHL